MTSSSIDAPVAAPLQLLKKIGSAIVAAIDGTAFAVIALVCAFVTYLVLLGFGNGAHGRVSDGALIFVAWLLPLIFWLIVLNDRLYHKRESGRFRRFENAHLHSCAIWWSRTKPHRRWHLACWPLLIFLFESSTTMQYSAPGADGMTTGCGEYLVRVNGVTLSAETPTIRALPWRCERVPLHWNEYTASTRATSSDGTKFDATVRADLALGDDPNLWPWKSNPASDRYPKIDAALAKAAQAAIGKVRSYEIEGATFALAINTAAALDLADAGVRPDGEISISLRLYFDGSESKLGAEKK